MRLSTGTSSARPGVSRSMHQAVSRVCLSSATSFSHSHSCGAAGRFGPFDRRPPRPTRAVADDDLPEAFCRSDMALEQCTSVTEKLIYNREGDAPSGVNRAHTHALRAELPFLRNYSSVLSWRPIYPGKLEPTTLPLRRLAPVSCSVGLSPTLSLPFSLALSCSLSCVPLSLSLLSAAPLCSFPTVSYPLSLSLSLSLPLAQKGGSGRLVYLYPPRGSNHPLQDRRGVVYPLGHDDGYLHHALQSFSPVCHPLSCVSSFAWGCV